MGHNTRMKPTCQVCGDHYSPKRKAAGYKVCLWCGEEQAMQERKYWCVVPMHKSNYQLVTNLEDLKAINPKRNETDTERYMAALYNNGEALL